MCCYRYILINILSYNILKCVYISKIFFVYFCIFVYDCFCVCDIVFIGGGRGIGQSIALRLAQEGGIVYILDKLRWKETVQLLNDTYGDNKTKCDGMRCDVTDIKQVTKCIESIIDQHGYIDVLINAVAQLDDGSKHSHEVSIDELQKSMNKNFYGFFNVSKVVLPYMKSEEYGRIVNIASINGVYIHALYIYNKYI